MAAGERALGPARVGTRAIGPAFGAEQVVLGGTALVCLGLILYPLAILLVSMFRIDVFGQPSRWTLENFAFLGSPAMLSATANTLLIALGATLLAGVIIVFVSAAGEFGVPLALGHPTGQETLTTQIFVLTEDLPAKYNRAAAAGAVLPILSIVCVWIQRRLIARRDFTTVTGKTTAPRRMRLGRWRWLALVLNLAYLLVAVVLPIGALLLVATSRSWTGEFSPARLTLDHFGYAFQSPVSRAGIVNSLILASGGATLGVVIGLVLGYVIHRTRARGRATLDVVTTIPIGVPGTVLALGILLAYIRTPLYATLWILLIGYLSRYMPYGQRSVSSVLLALSPELEQSARLIGLSWLQTVRRIIVPLVWPGMASAWLLIFVLFIRELPISLLLYQSGSGVLPVAIWRFVENESATRAAALALIQVLVLLGAVAVFRRLTGSADVLS